MGRKNDYSLDDTHRFINPYHFVPITRGTRKKLTEEGVHAGERHTGVLKCSLIVQTPVIIPDTKQREKRKEDNLDYYPFMREGKEKELMIPASSLRGPIRSVYEAATSSCLSTLKDNTTIDTRTSAKHPMKAGLLRKEGSTWKLYQSERYRIETKALLDKKLSDGDLVGFYGAKIKKIKYRKDTETDKKTGKKNNKKIPCGTYLDFTASFVSIPDAIGDEKIISNGKYQGIVYRGEPFGDRKRFESLFLLKERPHEVDEKLDVNLSVARFQEVLECYSNEDGKVPDQHGRYCQYAKAFREFCRGDKSNYFPVWYELDSGRNLHLSPACIGRYFYSRSLNDVLTEKYQPCRMRDEACPACSLFGMVGSSGEGQVGHVRFTDALQKKVSKQDLEEVKLRELGQPHLSYLPFYTEDACGYDEQGAWILGRKFYWHHDPDPAVYGIPEGASANESMASVMEKLDRGEFSFDVYYDSISWQQLRELIWVLCLGENDRDGVMQHTIGHAKPFGFGSVKICVEQCIERVYCADNGRYLLDYVEGEDLEKRYQFSSAFRDDKVMSALRRIVDARSLADLPKEISVRYPYVVDRDDREGSGNDFASHQWYTYTKEFNPQKLSRIDVQEIDWNAEGMALPRLKSRKAARRCGTIKTIKKSDRCFGFIVSDDPRDEDIYFNNYKNIVFDSLEKGMRVSFDIISNEKGLKAINVQRIE